VEALISLPCSTVLNITRCSADYLYSGRFISLFHWMNRLDCPIWRMCWKCTAVLLLSNVTGAGVYIKWSWMSDFGRSLVGVVWAAPSAAAWQWFDCLTSPALLFHTSSLWPATGAYKTLASLSWTYSLSYSSICLIPLDMHGLLCWIAFTFTGFDPSSVSCSI